MPDPHEEQADPFDLLQITETTEPTLEQVRAELEANKYKQKEHNELFGDLHTQLSEITAPALRHEQELLACGYPNIRTTLIVSYRLSELGGFAAAKRLGIVVDTKGATGKQVELRTRFVDRKEAFLRMARDDGVNEEYFSVNFPEGNAAYVLKPAQMLINLVQTHGGKLKNQVLVSKYLQEMKADVVELRNEDIKQEHGKYSAKQPTKFSTRAGEALYENLQHISRAGFTSFVGQPEIQEEFALKVFRASATMRSTADLGEIKDAPKGGPTPTDAGGKPKPDITD